MTAALNGVLGTGRSRTMGRRCVQYIVASVLTALALNLRGASAALASNDVDRVFSPDGERDAYSVFTNAPLALSRAGVAGMSAAAGVPRHYLSRLLAFGVTTNMANAAACLREKGEMVATAFEVFSDVLDVHDVRTTLDHAAAMGRCPTNHFAAMMRTARDRDAARGLPPQRVGARRAFSGTPGPSVRRAILEKRRIVAWNRAVEAYRSRLLEIAEAQLVHIWRNLPEEERRRRVASFLAPFASADKIGTNEIERMLETGLAAVATDRRQGALGVLAEELWRHLDSLTTNHAVCALLASARLQAFVEHELASVRVPERTVDMGPVLCAADGTRYRETTVERARAAAAERRTIARMREYLCQLRHFSENDPNRIDADALRRLYLSLNEDERREVMSRMVSILGRRPKWAPQREGGKR